MKEYFTTGGNRKAIDRVGVYFNSQNSSNKSNFMSWIQKIYILMKGKFSIKSDQKESLKNSMKSYELKDMSLLKSMGGIFKATERCPKGPPVIHYTESTYQRGMV